MFSFGRKKCLKNFGLYFLAHSGGIILNDQFVALVIFDPGLDLDAGVSFFLKSFEGVFNKVTGYPGKDSRNSSIG